MKKNKNKKRKGVFLLWEEWEEWEEWEMWEEWEWWERGMCLDVTSPVNIE